MASIMQPKVMFHQQPIAVVAVATFGCVKSKDEMAAFAGRLHEICDDMGIPQRGRKTQLAAKFKLAYQSVGKWLDGVGFPETERILELANWADVNVNWLLQGTGPKRGDIVDTKALVISEAIQSLPKERRDTVLELLGVQIEKSGAVIAGERQARYLHVLEAFKTSTKNKQ